jgi:hypothetical protein
LFIYRSMKIKALIVLVVFFLTVVMPLRITFDFDRHNKTVSFLTLNVCHIAGAALSTQADVPYVMECCCELSLYKSIIKYSAADFIFNPLLLASLQERPPGD